MNLNLKKPIISDRHTTYISVLKKLNFVLKTPLHLANDKVLSYNFYYALLSLRHSIGFIKHLQKNVDIMKRFSGSRKYFLNNRAYYLDLISLISERRRSYKLSNATKYKHFAKNDKFYVALKKKLQASTKKKKVKNNDSSKDNGEEEEVQFELFNKYFSGYRRKALPFKFYLRLFLFWFLVLYSAYLLFFSKIRFGIWLTFLGNDTFLYSSLFMKIYKFYNQKNYNISILFFSSIMVSYAVFSHRIFNFDKKRFSKILFKTKPLSKTWLVLHNFSALRKRIFFFKVLHQYRRLYVHLVKLYFEKTFVNTTRPSADFKILDKHYKKYRNIINVYKNNFKFKKAIKLLFPKLEHHGFSHRDHVARSWLVFYKFFLLKTNLYNRKFDTKFERASFVPSFKYPFKRKFVNRPFPLANHQLLFK